MDSGASKLKYKAGDPLNPYDPASLSLGEEGVMDRIAAGQSPLTTMYPEIFQDPAKLQNLMAFMKKTMLDDAKERERTGETVMEQMAREKAEWAAEDSKAASLKAEGNSAFKEGDYKQAFVIYSACMYLSPPEPLYALNRAAAGLKLRMFSTAEKDATMVLRDSSGKTLGKAYFRRAQASKFLGKLDKALEDLQRAKEMHPDDEGIRRELEEVEELRKLSSDKFESWVDEQGGMTVKDIFGSADHLQEQIDMFVKN